MCFGGVGVKRCVSALIESVGADPSSTQNTNDVPISWSVWVLPGAFPTSQCSLRTDSASGAGMTDSITLPETIMATWMAWPAVG